MEYGKLFHADFTHASPHGTYLIGCVLYKTIFGKSASRANSFPEGGPAALWDNARLMQPIDESPLPRPTASEAAYLRNVAARVTSGRLFNNETMDE